MRRQWSRSHDPNENQKLSANLTARTERSLAEKAGHLEMLAGGKKDGKGAASDAKRGGKNKDNKKSG